MIVFSLTVNVKWIALVVEMFSEVSLKKKKNCILFVFVMNVSKVPYLICVVLPAETISVKYQSEIKFEFYF